MRWAGFRAQEECGLDLNAHIHTQVKGENRVGTHGLGWGMEVYANTLSFSEGSGNKTKC